MKRLRTIVYVDGFNFYYGQVKAKPWKWLDLPMLFDEVLGPQNDIVKVKYFTAKVQPNVKDPQVNQRQDAYFNALKRHCEKVEICLGHFLRHEVWMENAEPPTLKAKVLKNEEQGSDVNLALNVLNDAWLNLYHCAVIVSNDSDLAMALRLVKQQNKKIVGLITPGAPRRKTSVHLKQCADFMRQIRPSALARAQLPNPVPGTSLHKPDG